MCGGGHVSVLQSLHGDFFVSGATGCVCGGGGGVMYLC